METKVKENGQAKANTAKSKQTTQFVAGNPVNAESKKTDEAKQPEQVKQDEAKGQAKPIDANPQEQPKTEQSKAEIREQLAQQKPTLNLDETLKLISDLAKKTALRDRYKDNIDNLQKFEELQKEQVNELEDETAFQLCELIITDAKGNRFTTKSPFVIKATIDFVSGRFMERLAEVEASIVLPA